jgi:hypothetical protein
MADPFEFRPEPLPPSRMGESAFILALLNIAGVLAYGGIQWLATHLDSKDTQAAIQSIKYSFIDLQTLVAFSAFVMAAMSCNRPKDRPSLGALGCALMAVWYILAIAFLW